MPPGYNSSTMGWQGFFNKKQLLIQTKYVKNLV